MVLMTHMGIASPSCAMKSTEELGVLALHMLTYLSAHAKVS